MEEISMLSNIATIIAKDIAVDNNDEMNALIFEEPSANLLESDDEAFAFFAKQQHQRQRRAPPIKGRSTRFVNNNDDDERSWTKSEKPKWSIKRRRSNASHRTELNLLNKFSVEDFEGHMHLNKTTFLKMFQHVRGILEEANFLISMPQTVFSLALWKLTTDDHYQEIERKFHIPIFESNTMIRQFWRIVSDKHQKYLSWPAATAPPAIGETAQLKGFANLLGVVALKRWHIFVESLDEEVAVMLQIVCDANEKILDCHIEMAADYRFDNTPIARALERPSSSRPPNSYLIGGNCFPLRPYLIRPYGVGRDCANAGRQDTVEFNRLLQPALEIGRNTLNALAMRFNALYALEAKDLEEVRKIAFTVCCLHNLCLDVGDEYVDRHKESVKFNWASSDSSQLHKYGDESSVEGDKRRRQLMAHILAGNLRKTQ